MRLYLDDERTPKINPHTWNIVRSYEEFVLFIEEKGLPKYISFDHDLGIGKNGYDCALWLVNYCLDHNLPCPEFNVHSANPVGADNIEGLLSGFQKFQEKNNFTENKQWQILRRFWTTFKSWLQKMLGD